MSANKNSDPTRIREMWIKTFSNYPPIIIILITIKYTKKNKLKLHF